MIIKHQKNLTKIHQF
ncbi:hypothetical protein FIT80_05105 [Candidatus Methylopumilus universalis]|nr:hypothetical protein FIT79_05040 [Candidatus Methylopumilus universalis]QDC91229.1 hypothetical protein FIT80_05105 [Candidatus Methylopumilus universalis]